MSSFLAFWDSLRARKRGFLRLLILLLVNAGVYGAVTYRLANKQDRLQNEQVRLTFELEQQKAALRVTSTAQTRVLRNEEAVDRFWTDVVRYRSPGLTEAWDEIDRLADESGVVRGRTGYGRELLDIGLEEIKASMPVEGAYFDLVRFINRLERSEHFFLVQQVRLSQRQSDDASILLDCSISFYLKAGSGLVTEADAGGAR